ncbi:hypothetical protein EYF80_024626 [Liparis tanakae]|uniref:Uncharacterized protein n=1 Tax=Liparis tanakae TaxID=230148 RepID=A0A4Z2HGY6_9TELE|nr:hypothetical protein EYF80_024626 [Liparis tanakae]
MTCIWRTCASINYSWSTESRMDTGVVIFTATSTTRWITVSELLLNASAIVASETRSRAWSKAISRISAGQSGFSKLLRGVQPDMLLAVTKLQTRFGVKERSRRSSGGWCPGCSSSTESRPREALSVLLSGSVYCGPWGCTIQRITLTFISMSSIMLSVLAREKISATLKTLHMSTWRSSRLEEKATQRSSISFR